MQGTPTMSSFTATIPDEIYNVTGSGWYPGDSSYQGSVTVPAACPSNGTLRLDKGGTFTANVS